MVCSRLGVVPVCSAPAATAQHWVAFGIDGGAIARNLPFWTGASATSTPLNSPPSTNPSRRLDAQPAARAPRRSHRTREDACSPQAISAQGIRRRSDGRLAIKAAALAFLVGIPVVVPVATRARDERDGRAARKARSALERVRRA